MKSRHLAACFAGLVLLGLGATLLSAQTPRAIEPVKREAIRPQLVKLRVEAEMLRVDYESAHDYLNDQLKMLRGVRLANDFFESLVARAEKPGKEDPKAVEARKNAEDEEKEYLAMEAAIFTQRNKELSRRFRLLTEKQLEVGDADRAYREALR